MGVVKIRILLIFTVFTLFLYQNCAPLEGTGGAGGQFSLGGTTNFATAKSILDTHCLTCHSTATAQNGNVSLLNYQAILDSGSVIGGNALGSRLYQSIDNGSMPQGRPPLSLNDSEAIRSWIDAGAPDENGEVANELPVIVMPVATTVELPQTNVELLARVSDPDGAVLSTIWSQISGPNTATFQGSRTPILNVSNIMVGTYTFELLAEDDFGAIVTGRVNLTVLADPTPPPPPPPDATVFFATQINPILEANCIACHTGANPPKGFSVESHGQVVTRVVAGNAATSPLSIRVDNESMPAGGAAPLSQAEKDLIRTWINEGARDN